MINELRRIFEDQPFDQVGLLDQSSLYRATAQTARLSYQTNNVAAAVCSLFARGCGWRAVFVLDCWGGAPPKSARG
jgi:hypothetical protein